MHRSLTLLQTFHGLLTLVALILTPACGDNDTVRPPNAPISAAKEVTSFVLRGADNPRVGRDVGGTISTDTITLSVPNGTDVTVLRPTIVHSGVQIAPASGEPRDFSNPVTYTVTAEDGSTASYTVTVTVDRAASNPEITAIDIDGFDAPAVIEGRGIAMTLPYGTDVSALKLNLSFAGVGVDPPPGSVQDLSQPVQYTVTAANGTAVKYTVSVSVAPSTAKDLTQLTIAGAIATISGSDIAVTVPAGTELAAAVPAITHTGVSIAPPASSAQDFRAPVEYAVTAADGSTKRYTVRVAVAPSSAKDMTQLTILGNRAVVSGNSATVTVPFGTDVTQLVPTLVHTGASVLPASGVAQNFSQPISYVVTAADGSTQRYTVAVNLAPSSSKDLTSLSILGIPAQISGSSLALTLPFGTDVRSLAPRIQHTGESVTPASGTLRDFSAPVQYTVVAADGSIRAYEVRVSVAPSDAKEIVGFAVLGRAASVGSSTVDLTVPFGVSLEALAPVVVHTGVSISPPSGTPQDFRTPVTYTITAGDGSSRSYTINLSLAASSSREITAFEVLGVTGSISGSTIALTLPFGTDLRMLSPRLVHSGANVSPASGQTVDLAQPVNYTVTAADGSTRIYTVIASAARDGSKDITAFTILNIPGDIAPNTVNLSVPSGTNLGALSPRIEITGASISPPSGTPQDFSKPVLYTVTAENGSKKTYTVTVGAAESSAKDITSFSILGIPGDIGPNTISVVVPFGTDVVSLTPNLHTTGVSVSPASGAATDFSQPVTYRVSAQDGSIKDYTVSVDVAQNSTKNITSFSILGIPANIGPSTISMTVPFGTDLRSLTPTLGTSGSSVSPPSGFARDFSEPQTYTVTAGDGSTKTYAVTVDVAGDNAKDITAFSILGIPGNIGPSTISVTVPFGTDPASLAPTITTTGVGISPASGVATSFAQPVAYRVTAQDGSFKDYTVSVAVAENSTKDITSFSILGIPGNIGPSSISLTVPYGTPLTSLTPTIVSTGVSVSPPDGTAQSFATPASYTVTADDGSTKTYLVTVSEARNSAKDITAFSILGIPANIGPNTVAVTIPYGTNLSNLTPTFTHTGVSVSVLSGAARDFSAPVAYVVTAEDGSTKTYDVVVNVASNSAKDITGFSILGVPGSIGIAAINVTLPYGNSRTSLTPTITTSGMAVSPASGVARDFSGPVTYAVTAQDGSIKSYTVTVDVALNTARSITSFSILGFSGQISGTNVTLRVPWGTDLTNLTPTIAIDGVTINPASGVTRSFASPVSYVVRADDGTTNTYTVNVTSARALDCLEEKTLFPASASGVYSIDPDGSGPTAPFDVYCDMTNHGGGWTLIGKFAAGNYTAYTDDAYRALVMNPSSDVNAALLQSGAAPTSGQMAFYDRPKTNALYRTTNNIRAVRVDMSHHLTVPAANGTFFQQRVNPPSDWDFWAALRSALRWNRDGSGSGTSVAYANVDFRLGTVFNATTNVVTHANGSFRFWDSYEHTLNDGSKLVVSRHFGLLCDGIPNIGYHWLGTSNPSENLMRWKNDAATQQYSLIWLR